MCRRPLTLLLLATLLLSQWAVASRCQVGCRTVGHDSRPHVHLPEVAPTRVEKSSCGCKRQAQATPPASDAPATSPTTTSTTPEPPCEDGGVLFLSFDLGLAVRAEHGAAGLQDDIEQVAEPVNVLPGLSHHFVGGDPGPHPSPQAHTLPVYLRTLRLRV